MAALLQLYGLGKEIDDTGISLLILCGLTRMVGTGLSRMNNIVDVSQQSKYHAICGISAKEIVACCSGKLDTLAVNSYNGQTLKEVLENEFVKDWDGFRFGFDNGWKDLGLLDPTSFDGALFSPLDFWEIVQSLVSKQKEPSSRWITSMSSEFEFASLSSKYLGNDERYFELYRKLQGSWVDTKDPRFDMQRGDYLTLANNLHVQKVLLELGLLSVKEIGVPKVRNHNVIRLGSTNWTVKKMP